MPKDINRQDGEQQDRARGLPVDTTRRNFLRAAGAGALALGASMPAEAAIVQETCTSGEEFEVANGNWHVLNNKWGDPNADQCIWRHDDGRYGWDSTSSSDGDINYPQAYCGGRPWGSDSGIPELPAQRGGIWEFQLEWDVALDTWGGDWNLAEEYWLLDGAPQSENPPIEYEVMLVLDWGSNLHHPMVEEGAISDQYGNQIDHWADYDHGEGWKFEIFRIAGGASSGQVDFTAIMDYMESYFGVSDSLTVTGSEVGTEIWGGGVTATFNSLDLSINGTTYESGFSGDSGGATGSISTGTYSITNVNSGKALDVEGMSTADGANIQQYDYWGGDNQKWYVEQTSDGSYRIENVNSGKVMDVEGPSTDNGANIHQWYDFGNDNQRWWIWEDASGEYVLEAVHSGKVADVASASTSDGANVQQYDDWGGANQRWYFNSV